MVDYLRIKKWRDHQHYRDREPPWIKMQTKLLKDDKFGDLDELSQWQLVRIWMTASSASRFTLDEEGRRVPVIANDEKTLRRAIGTLKMIPLALYVRDGWLIPVHPNDLCEHGASTDASNPCTHAASNGASALLGTEKTEELKKELQEQKLSKAVPVARHDARGEPTERPQISSTIRTLIDASLKEHAA